MSQIEYTLISRFLLCATLVLLAVTLPSQAQQPPSTPLSLEQIMAEPDWIGHPVQQAWWSTDGLAVYYRIQQINASLSEVHSIQLESGQDQVLTRQQQSEINTGNPVYDREQRRALIMRHGDIFLEQLDSGQSLQLTRTSGIENQAQFMSDGARIMYQRSGAWFIHNLSDGLVYQAADLRSDNQPKDEDHGPLSDQQLRLFSTLKRQIDEQQAEKDLADELAAMTSSDSDKPWYLGEDREIVDSSLSPSGDKMLVITAEKQADDGRTGKMPHYVTASGYVDIEDVRTRVGRNVPGGHQLLLLDLNTHAMHPLSTDDLPGITDDPLAELRAEQELDPLEGARDAWVAGITWNDLGSQVAIQWQAIDNKDRWLATVDFENHQLKPQHRLTDNGWINWNFNEFGWLPNFDPDAEPVLWFVSEQSGYAHFYTQALDRQRATQHTNGQWEVYNPVVSRDGNHVIFMANRERPIEYELYRLKLADNHIQMLTDLNGVESFTLAPDESQILVQYSGSYLPMQLAVVKDDRTQKLTDTRTDAFKAIQWQQPQFVQVPSKHDAGQPIWSKLYLPDFNQHPGPRPIVMFVHGAGYTQNTHQRYPYYFREQMFHNLLTQRGYVVLDMDFRASEGYGRDWRTAIYRQMGHPELEDLRDGLDWLSENYPVDRSRAGVYGGSYGGFITLMAMFNEPELFAAGGSLRPVTDWVSYNHGYTSNILNTPEVDPEAYLKSSPIEHAEGLQGHLLIAHGMLDDNVFYQDSVRLAQRLIELRKPDWELAGYPLERHSFVYADSWYDEYRRVLKLFEDTFNE